MLAQLKQFWSQNDAFIGFVIAQIVRVVPTICGFSYKIIQRGNLLLQFIIKKFLFYLLSCEMAFFIHIASQQLMQSFLKLVCLQCMPVVDLSCSGTIFSTLSRQIIPTYTKSRSQSIPTKSCYKKVRLAFLLFGNNIHHMVAAKARILRTFIPKLWH